MKRDIHTSAIYMGKAEIRQFIRKIDSILDSMDTATLSPPWCVVIYLDLLKRERIGTSPRQGNEVFACEESLLKQSHTIYSYATLLWDSLVSLCSPRRVFMRLIHAFAFSKHLSNITICFQFAPICSF